MSALDETAIALPPIPVDTWIKGSWDEFLSLCDRAEYEQGRFYYNDGWMRIEMASIGMLSARFHSLVSTVIIFYAAFNNIRIKELTNGSLRKTGFREAQPDISFYIGDRFEFPPRNNSSIDLDRFPPSHLVVEVGASSFWDDLGQKRLLYENLGVEEYWVVSSWT